MTKTLKINGATAVPISAIRRIRPVTEEDRARIAERYEQVGDAAKYQLQIEFADKSTKLATETLDDIRAQGIAVVNLGSDRYVPATNIKFAEPFTKEDADKIKEKDYTLSQTFRSRVETTAGTVLSSATPAQVIERREKAIEQVSAASKKAAPKASNG
ncbi:MAG: hypothetical protein J0I57_04115 [Hyphomicrobium sp.]|jgi:hypothetical protein|nr:hypothetical protein [Hyphomicrobium sp.]MBN9276801.1 hypothetical protein [Hyphomicrobium sp.]